MEINPIAFYIFSILAIAAALMVITKKNPVGSAFSLVFVFFCFAGLYAAMGVHLIATLQILVYAGAVMVLFIFVIMLLNADVPGLDLKKTLPSMRFGAAALSLGLLAVFVYVFKNTDFQSFTRGAFSDEAIEAAGGNTRVLSEVLFSEYVLPFELTSVLLLAGIVGAVAIAMRKKRVERRKPVAGRASG